MKFYSTGNKALRTSFRDAVIQGLAPDGGLFMPERIKPFDDDYFNGFYPLGDYPFYEMAFDVASRLIGDAVPDTQLKRIVFNAVEHLPKLVEVGENKFSLELYHGPTLAFKDYGARFLAGLMEYFAADEEREIVVLAATSGDTGSAVANGFYDVKGVRVIILYPSGKVSPLQEKQLTTLGGNITAWEVDGTFDDCQRLVKELFMDTDLKKKFLLTSANSINIGRLIPQTFYYFFAWARLCAMEKQQLPLVFSVPSGNFGNLTAGVMAKRLGLPVSKFIAATNANKAVPEFLSTGKFIPQPSVSTISNAMDVGNPSNFARLLDLFGDQKKMAASIEGYSFSDVETRKVMKEIDERFKYILDPHGAVAYLGLQRYQTQHKCAGVFLETAHPAKFGEVVEETLGRKIGLPLALRAVAEKEKVSVKVGKDLNEAKARLT
jgi:threonine synthase